MIQVELAALGSSHVHTDVGRPNWRPIQAGVQVVRVEDIRTYAEQFPEATVRDLERELVR